MLMRFMLMRFALWMMHSLTLRVHEGGSNSL